MATNISQTSGNKEYECSEDDELNEFCENFTFSDSVRNISKKIHKFLIKICFNL